MSRVCCPSMLHLALLSHLMIKLWSILKMHFYVPKCSILKSMTPTRVPREVIQKHAKIALQGLNLLVPNPTVPQRGFFMIKKIKNKYVVMSETTGRSFGSYRTLKEAKKRLGQVEFFKHRKMGK